MSGKLRFYFTRDSSLTSRLVRLVDGGLWSHVAVAVDGAPVCWEAYPGVGVRPRDVPELLASSTNTLQVTLEVDRPDLAIEFAVTHDGAPYDWNAILELAWRDLFGSAPHFGSDANDGFFCDELAIYMVECAGGVVLRDSNGVDIGLERIRVGVEGFRLAVLRAGGVIDG
jgi:hypothetical protein